MRVLLVNPEFPESFWGFQHALPFIGKRCGMPPLPLLTIAGMFPQSQDLKLQLIDMNVEPLTDKHLNEAEAVFITAMGVQKLSLQGVINRAAAAGKKVILGGPYATSYYDVMLAESWPVHHYVVGEVEEIFQDFFQAFVTGQAQRIWQAKQFPDIRKSPVPRFDLVNLNRYANIPIQFSRGCPFKCEFCDIIKLNGRIPRTKTPHQMLRELDFLFDCGWRGSVFFVDDNFIGNQRSIRDFLPFLIRWQKEHGYPFQFFTEASINLAKLPRLMALMTEAGFYKVFVGIETPNPQALRRTQKYQNIGHATQPDFLLRQVLTIQQYFEVMAGFITGLDGDGPESFDAISEFARQAGIPQAMTGLLTAYRNTDLYERLKKEGRLLSESDGNNVGASLNFVTELNPQKVLAGYGKMLESLYGHRLKPYYERCLTYFKHSSKTYKKYGNHPPVKREEIMGFIRSARALWGWPYVKFLLKVLIRYPKRIYEAVCLAAFGYHFQKVAEHIRQRVYTELDKLAS
jgi:radical SAM superfamily enzyme YgiQ (UPF0313 family)